MIVPLLLLIILITLLFDFIISLVMDKTSPVPFAFFFEENGCRISFLILSGIPVPLYSISMENWPFSDLVRMDSFGLYSPSPSTHLPRERGEGVKVFSRFVLRLSSEQASKGFLHKFKIIHENFRLSATPRQWLQPVANINIFNTFISS